MKVNIPLVVGILLFFSQHWVQAQSSKETKRSTTDSCSADANIVEYLNSTMSIFERVEPVLKSFTQVLRSIQNEIRGLRESSSDREWENFATSVQYTNTRMITSEKDFFSPNTLPKSFTLSEAKRRCMGSCANNQSCLAFNLYEENYAYVCEMLPDNLCLNKAKIAFVNWPGGTVWEKTSTGTRLSCLDTKYPQARAIPCEVLRPGCSGTWPHCSDCDKTCINCKKRYDYGNTKNIASYRFRGESLVVAMEFSIYAYFLGHRECTLWPEEDQPFVLPIFGLCKSDRTYFLVRTVEATSGKVIVDYQMSLFDLYRLWRLKAYPIIDFLFGQHWFEYKNWVIDADGVLSNLTLHTTSPNISGDIFNLGRQALKPTRFVPVEEDDYGCGSFWLIDSNNATYCPGGKVSMLGKVVKYGDKVVNTGMTLPPGVAPKNEQIFHVYIRLVV